MQISLCMIVKDEEQQLPRCLQSVQGLVDEMIVVDTGSRDRTIAIAQQFGAAVYDWTWQNDFAAARNYALQYVQSEWILVLDADEVLRPECVTDLQTIIQLPDVIAVTLLRQEIGSQQTPYSQLSRLFRHHPHLWFERPYHETIDDRVSALIAQEPHWRVMALSEPAIAHDGYRPDAIAGRNKMARAEQIMGDYLKSCPSDAYICSKLGGLYVSQGRHPEALDTLNQGLQQQPGDAAVRYELHYHLGLTYTAINQPLLARQQYEQALQTALPDLLKLATFINLAALQTHCGELSQAELLLLQVLQLQPHWAIAQYNLGLVYKAQGQFSKAITAYQQAIKLQSAYPEAHQNLGVVYLKLGQIQQGLAAFRQAILLYQPSRPTEALRLQQMLMELGWQV